jgi:hypothetical protein
MPLAGPWFCRPFAHTVTFKPAVHSESGALYLLSYRPWMGHCVASSGHAEGRAAVESATSPEPDHCHSIRRSTANAEPGAITSAWCDATRRLYQLGYLAAKVARGGFEPPLIARFLCVVMLSVNLNLCSAAQCMPRARASASALTLA